MSVKIFGVGNVLMGDDGIGVAVAHRITPPTAARVYIGEIFVDDCLIEIETGDIVIILDAMLLGGAPCDVRVFTFDECRSFFPPQALGHDTSLLYSLLNANTLVQGFLIGIQVQRVDCYEGLSPCLQAGLDEIVANVDREVAAICMKLL